MIRLDVEQGSPAWRAARVGIPTCSRYDDILTPKTLKLSGSSEKYRAELLAEWLLGEPIAGESYDFTDRGTAMEQEARDWYEMHRDVTLDRVGFLLRDDRRTGGSPDALVGADGGLELKCPSAAVHVGYLLDTVGDKYRCQVQGNLWIAERAWWDVLSYHPSLPRALVRVYRDEKFITALARMVDQFLEYVEEGKRKLERQGVRPAPSQLSLVA